MLNKFAELVRKNKQYAKAVVVGVLAATATLGYVVPPWVGVVLQGLGLV